MPVVDNGTEPTGDEKHIGSERILMVGDDRSTRECLRQLCSDEGLALATAHRGPEAVGRLRSESPALVLVDFGRNDRKGFDCCRSLRAGAVPRSFTPLVWLAASSPGSVRVEALGLDVDVVTKPLDRRELGARLRYWIRIRRMHVALEASRQRLSALVLLDEETGLYNRRYTERRLAEEFHRAERFKDPLSLALIDLARRSGGPDDRSGSLRTTAERLKRAVRSMDVVARQGQERFLAILPGTHLAGALSVGESIFRSLSDCSVEPRSASAPTFSIGLAVFPGRGITDHRALRSAAERAVAQAKREPRESICVVQDAAYVYRPP